jgi:hypothetical protein
LVFHTDPSVTREYALDPANRDDIDRVLNDRSDQQPAALGPVDPTARTLA